jgi:hypothetical protein
MMPKEVIDLVKWEEYPLRVSTGQTCGKIETGMTLRCPEIGFEISIDASRSQLRNKELCWTFFELFYSERFK